MKMQQLVSVARISLDVKRPGKGNRGKRKVRGGDLSGRHEVRLSKKDEDV